MFGIGKDSSGPESPTHAETGDSTPSYSAFQKSESSPRSSAESVTTIKTVAESTIIAREITNGILSAFVGSGSDIIGQVSFESLLRVDGHFSGRISSVDGTLIVAAGARVDAKIAVAVAEIHGIVTGDIVATNRIEFGPASKLIGNIQAPTLVVQQGAVLEGNCRMKPPEAVSEHEDVSEQRAMSEQTIAAEASSQPETAAKQIALAADQKTPAEKPPEVPRKQNVRGTRTGRTRAKVATAKGVDDKPAATAATG
jgi:cytoskeletal protein CcmA (bactofilin family)